MLKSVHHLMQLGQKRDVYICNYLDALKWCQADITFFYINERTKFQHDVFWHFKALVGLRHEAILMRWVCNALNLNADACEYLPLTLTGHSVRRVHRDLITGEAQPITHELFAQILEEVNRYVYFPLKLCTNSSSFFHVTASPFGSLL
jgi:hypothetical protein